MKWKLTKTKKFLLLFFATLMILFSVAVTISLLMMILSGAALGLVYREVLFAEEMVL